MMFPASTKSIARSFFNPLVDFIFPGVCLNCQQSLPDGQQYVCEACWNSIERLNSRHPLYKDTHGKLLKAGFANELISCFVFHTEGAFQTLAHAMKYEKFEKLGIWLGRALGEELVRQNIRADYLIPVPLHKRKRRERGYNQAELIARGVSAITNIPARANIVQRWRFTETQTKLHIDERKKNMEDAFEIMPGRGADVRGKICIVVDDVITTGATINSCAGELKAAGATNVIAASLALAE